MTESYLNSAVEVRKKLSRVSKKRLVFIDGSGIRSESRPQKGLELQQKSMKNMSLEWILWKLWVILLCETKTSGQRKAISNPKKRKKGVKGYTKPMVKNFLKNELAPKIMEMKVKYMIVCMDKELAFKAEEAKE